MKAIVSLLSVAVTLVFFSSCKSDSGTAAPVCDSTCVKDSMKFTKEDNNLKPSVFISAQNCMADSVSWTYDGMGSIKTMGVADLAGAPVQLNKTAVDCFINDTSYAWLRFNDCRTGRGFIMKIPFNKGSKLERKSSALNSFDHKYNVAAGLIAYSDRGNLFVEDMASGKQALMTFGERVEIDYDHLHEFIDSVSVSPTAIWAKVKVKEGWKTFEKNITLK